MNNFEELLKKRFSIRKFQDKPVSGDIIDTLARCVLTAPTSKNTRAWHFAFITNSDVKQELAKAKDSNGGFISNAPLAIVVMADQDATSCWVEDCAIAATTLQLSAVALGLGSCWVQIRERKDQNGACAEDKVRKLLGKTDNYRILCILAVGYMPEDTINPHRPHQNDDQKFDIIK